MPKLFNKSRISDKKILKVIEFIQQFTFSKKKAAFEVRGPSEDFPFGEGMAVFMVDRQKEKQYKHMREPGLVVVQLGSTPFPHENTHRISAGRVFLNSHEEELVLIIAHELRHIDQFYLLEVAQEEADAEKFAVSILEEWRNRKKSKS